MLSPPVANTYNTLEEQLTQSMATTKVAAVLHGKKLGDHKPTKLLNHSYLEIGRIPWRVLHQKAVLKPASNKRTCKNEQSWCSSTGDTDRIKELAPGPNKTIEAIPAESASPTNTSVISLIH